MCPATPSSNPLSANILKAAAKCCFRYNLSSSKDANSGYDRILRSLPSLVFPLAAGLMFPDVLNLPTGVVVTSADGAIVVFTQ